MPDVPKAGLGMPSNPAEIAHLVAVYEGKHMVVLDVAGYTEFTAGDEERVGGAVANRDEQRRAVGRAALDVVSLFLWRRWARCAPEAGFDAQYAYTAA